MTPEQRLASLAKPPHSLGLLEEWASVLSKLQRTLTPSADPVSILVFCADHGVKKADAAISPYPPSVTQAVFFALARGLSGTAVLAESVGAHLTVVDCGIDGDVQAATGSERQSIAVVHSKVARGTANFVAEPAMTESQLHAALRVGQECVASEISQRAVQVVCVGETGIGNTTSAAALLACLTGADAGECCGRGTGLDDSGYEHKIRVVRQACELHRQAIETKAHTDVQVREALRRLGGFEIASMVGAYVEAADRRIAAVVDGFISAVAALCAVRMEPLCRANMVFATNLAEEHLSIRGGEILTRALDARPALSMGLALGEGSGAAAAVPLLRSAVAVIARMGTLEEVVALSKI